MKTEKLALIRHRADLADTFHQMMQDYRGVDEHNITAFFDSLQQDFSAYLQRSQDAELGKNLLKGFVPYTSFWLVKNDSYILGLSHLRHYLTPGLKIEGGHIGYSIRPSERKKGYGVKQLALVLEACKQFELEKVMVTCDFDNIGSIKIIEANGGIRTGEAISPRSNKKVYHYWITL